MNTKSLTPELLRKLDTWWRAANYLSVGQIYLCDNPQMRKPLRLAHTQTAPARPLGRHSGTKLHLRPPEPDHQGPRPQRHQHHRAGNAYNETGEGRCWPILTGERGHYELAAGRDPLPFIEAMEKFANAGGMLPEQLWDADDLPEGAMKRGGPTGSALPLCWAHAEYVTLVRSHHDGVCFDRIEPVYQRYAKAGTRSKIDIWTLAHQLQRIVQGNTVRIITEKAATIHWSVDEWATAHDLEMRDVGFGCWFGDFPSAQLQASARIVFTILWQAGWEGKDFQVEIATLK